MDRIDKSFYDSSMKDYKKLSNEKLIMTALKTLLDDINQLKAHHEFCFHKSVITEALKDEFSNRIYKKEKL